MKRWTKINPKQTLTHWKIERPTQPSNLQPTNDPQNLSPPPIKLIYIAKQLETNANPILPPHLHLYNPINGEKWEKITWNGREKMWMEPPSWWVALGEADHGEIGSLWERGWDRERGERMAKRKVEEDRRER